MQKSYKKIKENEIDGLIVDKVEYKYMNFEDMDEEIELLLKEKSNFEEIKNKQKNEAEFVEINSEEKGNNKSLIDCTIDEMKNLKNDEEYDDDIDGEPI